MSFIIKIAGIGFLVCLINPILKKHSPQTAAAVTVVSSVIIFSNALKYVYEAFSKLKGMSGMFNINIAYGETVLKVILIAWVCEFVSSVIEDTGEKAVAKKIEFAGKIFIFVMIFPLLTNLCESVISLIR